MTKAVQTSQYELPELVVTGNRLQLIHHATERMQAVINTIGNAQYSLKLFFYMFEGDNAGKTILASLIDACDRGVAVELMVDSFGSNDAPVDFFDPLVTAGGKFATFSPRFSTSYFVRNHQKMIIADDVSAVIGGFNIADRYFDSHENEAHLPENPTSWEDLGLLIHGAEVARLSDYFDQLSDWVNHQNGNIRALRKIVKNWPIDDGPFQWLLGGPSNRLSRWAWSIKNDLEDGQQLDLISAYFSPGLGLRRRMARISNRNGHARLILPGKTDNAATIGASRSLYGYLLKRKTKIYEYQPKRLHMKMVIIDNITYIGSANFDLRSLYINVEMMLRIEDEAFADQARSIAENLVVSSEPITWDLHRSRRSFLNRMRWAISYFVVNIVDYSVTRRLNFGVKK